MIKIHFALMFALLAQTSFAQTVYKSTDANGNTVFSDKPSPNSTEIHIAPAQTYSPPPLPTPPTPTSTEKSQVEHYTIAIEQPQNDQMFGIDVMDIQVKLAITPHLQREDQIMILLNDQPYGNFDTSSITLAHLPRGTYRMQVNIVSKHEPNQIKAQSEIITFYQQRARIHQSGN